MKKSEQKLRALVKFLGSPRGVDIEDVKIVLDELTETRRTLAKVRSLLLRKQLDEMENDDLYALVADLLILFEEDIDEQSESP